MNQADIRAALAVHDRDTFMLTLRGEVASEPTLGRVAVASVIKRRADHGRWWGRGIAGVCLAKWQFSCWYELTSTNSRRLYAVAEQLLNGQPFEAPDAALHTALYAIADAAMRGEFSGANDPSHGADSYVTHYQLAMAPPKWALTAKPCALVGAHTFYRLEL